MEKRLNSRISVLEDGMKLQTERLNRVVLNLDTMYDRLCSDSQTVKAVAVSSSAASFVNVDDEVESSEKDE